MGNKVYYVGGGPSSIISSLVLKRRYPNLDVFVIERNEYPLKKLRMTGNGKCNIAPLKDDISKYNNQEFVKELFEYLPLEEYLSYLRELGIITKVIKDYGYYPVSESAPNVSLILYNKCLEYGIKFIKDTIVDYKKNSVYLDLIGENDTYHADYVIFASGGKSHPETGSDGSLFEVFKKHGYKVNELIPSLCPIKVKENVKELFGVRNNAMVTLYENDRLLKVEHGEVMFKKDGLSGICVMNISKYINKDNIYTISVDLIDDLIINYQEGLSIKDFLLSIVKEPMMKYLSKRYKLDLEKHLDIDTYGKIIELLRDVRLTVSGLYDFKEAQVTRGGIILSEINKKFSSNKEENVYFIGEVLDVDAECGGYNLRFAITSGIMLALRFSLTK